MKNVLLTTTALVAFAGAAVAADADLAYSGEAEAGYDFTVSGSEYFYWTAEARAELTLTQELNNGAVASLSYGVEVDGDDVAGMTVTPDSLPVATLETSYGTISAGDISNVNDGVFAEVAGMDVNTDGTADDATDDTGTIDFGTATHILRAETTLGGFALAASTDADASNVSANASGSAAGMDFAVFYETNSAAGDTTLGLNVSGDFSGVSFAAAYADDGTDTSMGLGLGYDISSTLSASASYAQNSIGVDQIAVGVAYDDGSITASADYDVDAEELDLAVGYSAEVSPGVTASVGVELDDVLGGGAMSYSIDVAYVDGDLALYAGYDDADGYYAGADYDLGGGASAFAYTSEYVDAGPLEWALASRVGVSISF